LAWDFFLPSCSSGLRRVAKGLHGSDLTDAVERDADVSDESGKTVRMYWTDGRRLVLLPPKSDGAAVLLETTDPEKFVREVRQEWSGRS
jgi:hypothetical protein